MHECGSCGNCGRSLALTQPELDMLQKFAQLPFLAVARAADGETPVYLEDTARPAAEYGTILLLLEKKGLVSIDYDKPLKNGCPAVYASYPIVGSMALTARGQQVLEVLDLQGIEE